MAVSTMCSPVADRFSCHTALLVFTFAASLFLRCLLLMIPARFLAVAALVLLSDCIGSPVGAIVDATVVGACKSDGDYGKHRMWASAAWGGLSVVAGSLVASKGLEAGFVVYCVFSFPCLYIASRIRKDAAAAAAAEKATNEASVVAAAKADVAFATTPLLLKQQLQAAATGKTNAGAFAAQREEDEDLMARLLLTTPDSSCYGSYANSSCGGGSRQCSPSPDMVRAASPFSRFSARGFEGDSSPHPTAVQQGTPQVEPTTWLVASPAAGSAVDGPVGMSPVQLPTGASVGSFNGSAPPATTTADDATLIKAWYEESQEQKEGDSAEQLHLQPQQQREVKMFRDSPEFVAGPAEAALLDKMYLQSEPAVAPAWDDEATTAVVVATKQSARLEDKVSSSNAHQLLQPSYSLVDWKANCNPDLDNPTAAENATEAATGAFPQPCSEPVPLDSKQSLPVVTAVDAAAPVTIRSLLVKPAVLVFMWRALIIGLGLGTIGNFLFLHVEELGGTGTLFGLMLCFNCITEVPAFMFQSTVLENLPVSLVFNASMLLLALRLAGYGLLPLLHSPWAVLPLELLHGVTFATSWGAGIVHCKRLAPPHLNASMQGLFSSLYGGVGSGLGALLGGVLMQELGGQALFFIVSCVVLCGWLLGYVLEKVLVRKGASEAADAHCAQRMRNC